MKTVSTIKEMIELTYLRNNVLSKLSGGEWRYWVANRWVDQDAFNILYPQAVFVPDNKGKGDNVCRKQLYLSNKKSY